MAGLLAAIVAAGNIAALIEGPGGQLLRDVIALIDRLTREQREPTPEEMQLINLAMNAAVDQAKLELKTP